MAAFVPRCAEPGAKVELHEQAVDAPDPGGHVPGALAGWVVILGKEVALPLGFEDGI